MNTKFLGLIFYYSFFFFLLFSLFTTLFVLFNIQTFSVQEKREEEEGMKKNASNYSPLELKKEKKTSRGFGVGEIWRPFFLSFAEFSIVFNCFAASEKFTDSINYSNSRK